ncbi:hypothetical protein Tco_0494069 [Tanacetum coccineum]
METPSTSTPIGHFKAIFVDNGAPSVRSCSIYTNKLLGVSFVSDCDMHEIKKENKGSSRVLSCQLLLKESNPGCFTLPCTIVEVADMSKKVRRGIVKNVIVKINKFVFPSDFVVINMLGEINETMMLGRPFLTTIHVRINVFHKEISLGIGDDKILIDMNGKIPIVEYIGNIEVDVIDIWRLHSYKPIRVETGRITKLWLNCDPNFKECNGGDSIYGRNKCYCFVIIKDGKLNMMASNFVTGSGGGRGVKEKNTNVSNIEAVKEKDLNDEHVAMEVQSPLVDHTNAVKTSGGSYPPLPTQEITPAGNTPGKSSYANVIGESMESIRAISERFVNNAYGFFLAKQVAYPVVANYVRNTWGKFGLVKSMLNSSTGLFSFQFSSMDGLNSMLENGPWFIRNHPFILRNEDGSSAIAMKLGTPLMLGFYTSDMCLQSWGRSSYARVMIELQADMELKDNIVVAMPKIMREGHYTCIVRVEYEWKPRVSVGLKEGFKPHKEYRPVPKKPTASPSGNKKKGVTQTTEVRNSNLFDVLNSVDNDAEFSTNRGTTNLVNNGANSSGSSFINVKNSSTCNTLIIDKVRMFEDLLIDGQAILVDEAGNPLKKVECSGDYDSEDEVASIDNDMARFLASERVGFGTQSFLKQWRDSYGNGDYDEDPYDDDMYEGQDISQEIQAICDNLDICVRGRKKK